MPSHRHSTLTPFALQWLRLDVMTEMIMEARSLRSQIQGSLVHRSDAAYESARRSLSWNTYLAAGSPEAIVQVASDSDVVTAVDFARRHGARIAISGGGHGLCGPAPADGALLLDLSRLDGMSIDAADRRARAGPAVRSRDFAHQLGACSLAFPYGHCSTVALSGYLLSGGFGWNSGQWGPACFSVAAVDVVLANGSLITANDTTHADVLWAARGAGASFFGVATRYQLVLHSQPRIMLTSSFVCPLADAAEIAAWLSQHSAMFPCELEIMLALTGAPAHLTARCASNGGMACIVNATVFAESEDRARSVLAALEACPAIDRCYDRRLYQPTSFAALFDGMDRLFPPRHRYLAHTVGTDRNPGELLAAIEPLVRHAPSRQSLILCPIIAPPPASALAPPAAAFSIAASTLMMAYAIWDDVRADAVNRAWHETVVDALEPFAACHYIGETDIASRPERAARCFAPANWQRLQHLRKQYDPDGLFRSLAPT